MKLRVLITRVTLNGVDLDLGEYGVREMRLLPLPEEMDWAESAAMREMDLLPLPEGMEESLDCGAFVEAELSVQLPPGSQVFFGPRDEG